MKKFSILSGILVFAALLCVAAFNPIQEIVITGGGGETNAFTYTKVSVTVEANETATVWFTNSTSKATLVTQISQEISETVGNVAGLYVESAGYYTNLYNLTEEQTGVTDHTRIVLKVITIPLNPNARWHYTHTDFGLRPEISFEVFSW